MEVLSGAEDGEAGEEPAGPYRMNCDEAYPT